MTDAPEGIEFLDHTADVGMDVSAPTRTGLFHRAAMGMIALLRGREEGPGLDTGLPDPDAVEVRTVELHADDGARLLAAWLKELLFLHEIRHADYAGARFDRLTEGELSARVETEPAAPAVREIKGVTYHELALEETGEGWKARVIFDV